MRHLANPIFRTPQLFGLSSILILFSLFVGSNPALSQGNSVESFSISAVGRDDGRTGIGTLEVTFLYKFAGDIKAGDLESVKLESSGSNLAAAVNRAGKWDYPSKSVLRLVVPLPDLITAGAVLADGSTSITFTSQMNLAGKRQQKATVAYDFIALDEVMTKPVFIGSEQDAPADSTRDVVAATSPKTVPTLPAEGASTTAGTHEDPSRISKTVATTAVSAAFPAEVIPEILAQESRTVGPEGGRVALVSGATVNLPPGALSESTAVSFSRVKSSWEDMELYHVSAGAAPLAVAAQVSLPLPTRPGNEIIAVDVLHLHDMEDRGSILATKWQPGDKEVTFETKEFSIIGVVIVWSGFTYLVGRELTIKSVANTPEKFTAAVEAAINVATNKSILLPSVGYNQFSPNTMWCWSSSFAALLHTVRPLDKHLAEPLKPQSIAALWKYNRAGYIRTGPSPVEWLHSGGDLFSALSTRADAPVEVRYYPRYPALAIYIISQVDQGYPVALDGHSGPHMLNIVGYDSLGPYVHDPAMSDQPSHAAWASIYTVLNKGLLSFSGNYALTTVIKRDVRSHPQPYAINLPSCEFNAVSSAHTNESGLYFTLPVRGGHAGFKWDGKAERYGLRLVAGQPEGPETEAIEELVVGIKTKVGEKNVEVTNSSADPVAAKIRLEMVEEKTKRSVTILTRDVTIEPLKISKHNLDPVELFPVLKKEFQNSGSLLWRTVLSVDGVDKDMVLAALKYRLFSLGTATATVRSTGTVLELRGAGFKVGEMELIVEIPGHDPQTIAAATASNDTELNVPLEHSMPALRDAQVFLRIKPSPAGWWGSTAFDRVGLETNRVKVISGGGMREVSTADDPERYIPPPPTEPLQK